MGTPPAAGQTTAPLLQQSGNCCRYLETREKEDAFLLRVLETIRAGFDHAAPTGAADALLQLLQGVQPEITPAMELNQEEQQEMDELALDFVDGF